MDVWPHVHVLQCGARLGEKRPGARERDVRKEVGKRNQEKETGRSQGKEAGGKEPAVAPGIGTRECNRYADTIMGVSTTVGSACGIICIQQI